MTILSQRSAPLAPGLALLLVLGSGVLPACAHFDVSLVPHVERMLWVSAAVYDGVETKGAIGRGAVELNPLLGPDPSAGRLVAVKAGGYLATAGIEGWLRAMQPDHRPPTWARWFVWGIGIAVQTWAAQHNGRMAR